MGRSGMRAVTVKTGGSYSLNPFGSGPRKELDRASSAEQVKNGSNWAS